MRTLLAGRTRFKAVLLAMASLAAPQSAFASGGFDQTVVFGDSTADDGYFRYTSTGNTQLDALITNAVANGGTAAFVGPGGVENTDRLAAMFGLSLTPSSNGGTNFANGGALSAIGQSKAINGTLPYPGGFPDNVPTTAQIANYLQSFHGTVDPNGLYLVATGGNDLILAGGMVTGSFSLTASPSYGTWTMAQAQSFLDTEASSVATSIAALQAAGGRTIIVPDVYLKSLTLGAPAAEKAAYNQVGDFFYGKLWADLAARGVNFIPADYNAVFAFVSSHPATFGFTPQSVLSSFLGVNPNEPCPAGSLSFFCSAAGSKGIMRMSAASDQQTSLFIDGIHLSNAGQTIQADYLRSLLMAPSQMSLLATTGLLTGRATAVTILDQIDIEGRTRGPEGFNFWIGAGGEGLNAKNRSNFVTGSETGFTGTIGVDYRFPMGLILGAAINASADKEDFSAEGGNFKQTTKGVNVYAAYSTGGLWGEALAGYTTLQDSTTRLVKLGTFTDTDKASTHGRIATLAARGGYNMRFGDVTTGPVVGVVRELAVIAAFAENGISNATNLAFGHQVITSIDTPIGWRGAFDAGDLQPFLEVDWNHEWANRNHVVAVTILTPTASPYPYFGAAAPASENWGTTSAGTSYKLSPTTAVRASVSASFGGQQSSVYGGQINLSVGL